MPAKIHGLLASAASFDGTPVTIYTVPTSRKATVTFNVANDHNAANILTNVSLGGAIIEAGVSLPANGVLERNGLTLAAGQSITATRIGTSGAVRYAVWGIEEDV